MFKPERVFYGVLYISSSDNQLISDFIKNLLVSKKNMQY